MFAPAERIDELTELEIKRARADVWDVLSRLPREAMIQAGVDGMTADEIVNQRNERYAVALNAGAFGEDYEEQG